MIRMSVDRVKNDVIPTKGRNLINIVGMLHFVTNDIILYLHINQINSNSSARAYIVGKETE